MRTAKQILEDKLINSDIILDNETKAFILSCMNEALIEGMESEILEECPHGYEPKFCDHRSEICRDCAYRKLSN